MTTQTIDPNRPPQGSLNGVDAPIGTLLGPDSAGQMFSVIDRDDKGVIVGYATLHERDAALAREPQSLAEIALQRQVGLMP